jgi:hypothetical protein
MTSFIRTHLSYANVVATIALVLAMGGSALAATHFSRAAKPKEFTPETKSKEFGYLITSIDQLSPRVQAALKATGRTGPTGPEGVTGATGPPGPEGPSGPSGAPATEGPQGKEGAEGKPGLPGARGEPGAPGEEGLSLLSKSEQETLKSIIPYIKYVASGVGGKPTILFSGANLQIVDGEGLTEDTNGAGNLIIGYDENPRAEPQTGSHNLILGPEQRYTSYGSILGGRENKALGPYDFVVGIANKTGNEGSSVGGGFENTAGFELSSIFGGKKLSTKAEYEAIG